MGLYKRQIVLIMLFAFIMVCSGLYMTYANMQRAIAYPVKDIFKMKMSDRIVNLTLLGTEYNFRPISLSSEQIKELFINIFHKNQ